MSKKKNDDELIALLGLLLLFLKFIWPIIIIPKPDNKPKPDEPGPGTPEPAPVVQPTPTPIITPVPNPVTNPEPAWPGSYPTVPVLTPTPTPTPSPSPAWPGSYPTVPVLTPTPAPVQLPAPVQYPDITAFGPFTTDPLEISAGIVGIAAAPLIPALVPLLTPLIGEVALPTSVVAPIAADVVGVWVAPSGAHAPVHHHHTSNPVSYPAPAPEGITPALTPSHIVNPVFGSIIDQWNRRNR